MIPLRHNFASIIKTFLFAVYFPQYALHDDVNGNKKGESYYGNISNFKNTSNKNNIPESDKELMKNVRVVYSNEKPINNNMLGSTSYVPAIAGLLITNIIINDINTK